VPIDRLASPLLALFTRFLAGHRARHAANTAGLHLRPDEPSADRQLAQAVLCGAFDKASLLPLLLTGLARFLNDLFSSAIGAQLNSSDLRVFRQVQALFIDLNGDLACLDLAAEQVRRFFNSPVTVSIYAQQLRNSEFDIYLNHMSRPSTGWPRDISWPVRRAT